MWTACVQILRKELDILKNRVLKAEATAAEAGKKYDDENKKVKELQAQFKAADDVRQAAYAQWQSLRKELSKKVMDLSVHTCLLVLVWESACALHIDNDTQRLIIEEYIKLDLVNIKEAYAFMDHQILNSNSVII